MNISKNRLLIIVLAVIVLAILIVLFLNSGSGTMMDGGMNGRMN